MEHRLRVPLIRTVASAGVALGFPVAGVLWSLSHTRPSIGFAFAVNWGLMGFAFLTAIAVPLRFWPGYYRTFTFERGGLIYERLGVRAFQRFLRRARVHGPAPFPRVIGAAGGLRRLVSDTYTAETGHAMIFVVVLVVAGDAFRRGWWDTALWLLVFNVLLNLYPVFSMRHIRARVEALRPA